MLHNKFILLVEDDPNDVIILQRAFKKAGMQESLRVVRNGKEAMEYLSGRGEYSNRERFPLPFLVLLDLRMAGPDGFEVLHWVRSQPEMRRLLVVVLTSSSAQTDVDRAYELGANSYLVKPVAFEAMVHLVQRFEAYWSELNRTPTGVFPTKPDPATSPLV